MSTTTITKTTSKFQRPILGIYPGTRGFGFALLTKPNEILESGVTTVTPVNNETCMARIKRYFDFYEPILVVTRDDDKEATTNDRVKDLVGRIRDLAEKRGIKTFTFNRQEIRNVFDQFGAKTKYEIAQTIVTWMPSLAKRMPRIRKAWMDEDYNMAMFDALSLIYTYYYLED